MILEMTRNNQTVRANLGGLSVKQIFAVLVCGIIAKHKYVSKDAFITNLRQIVTMMQEVATKDQAEELIKLSRSVEKRINFIAKHKPENICLEQDVWDTVMTSEGMPNLRGFGFSNRFKDPLRGNSEKMSITDKLKER